MMMLGRLTDAFVGNLQCLFGIRCEPHCLTHARIVEWRLVDAHAGNRRLCGDGLINHNMIHGLVDLVLFHIALIDAVDLL